MATKKTTRATTATNQMSADSVVKRIARPAGAKSAVLLVGIPASGKSSFAPQLEKAGYLRLSMDDIRARLLGDEANYGDAKQQKQVRDTFRQELEDALAKGLNVLIDNTNFNQRTRNPVLDRIKAAGYTDVQLLVMDVPLDECLRRNALRKRVVAESIVRMMHGSLNGGGWPQASEGRVIAVQPTTDREIFTATFSDDAPTA